MGKYVESNLGKNEMIVKKAKLSPWGLVGTWIMAILFCWLLLIPVFKAIAATIRFIKTELAITNKKIVGKYGVFNTKAMDAPLNKVQNISVEQKIWGKIFNFGTVQINTAAGLYKFERIAHADEFKRIALGQIEQYEEDRVKQQAAEMATAMASALNKQ